MFAFFRLFWYHISIGNNRAFKEISQIYSEGHIVKTSIILFFIASIMFFVAGCGPGQPFEIEGMHTPQSESPAYVVAAR